MKVLVVEDSLSVGKTLAAELAVFQYEILGPVATGEEAIALCRRQRPDVVLMDIQLSGQLNGVETAKRLQGWGKVPVIYLTGRVEDAMLQQVIESGSSTYLLKPVRAAELRANIEMTCRLARTQQALEESEAKHRYLLENMYDGYAYLQLRRNAQGQPESYLITETNEAFGRLMGAGGADCLGQDILQVFPELRQPEIQWADAMAQVIKYKKAWQLPRLHCAAVDRWFSLQAACPQPEHLGIILTDITDRVQAEEDIRFLGFHDALTALYNRGFFETEFERLDQERQLPLSIIFADMNNLKYINDNYGHTVGDECLIQLANILREACRREDIVCRWGGDEFVILLPVTSNDVGSNICQRIRRRCRQLTWPGGEGLCPGVALGCATKGIVQQSAKEVFKEAEARMYLDKAAMASLQEKQELLAGEGPHGK